MDFKLKKPLRVHGKNGAENLSVLTLREPTFVDTLELDPPYFQVIFPISEAEVKEGKRPSFSRRKDRTTAGRWIELLSGRTGVDLVQLSVADGNNMVEWIWRELNPEDEDDPADAIKNSDAPPAS